MAPLILSTRGSFFWNAITSLRPLFHSCSQFHIASGDNVSFWFDGWDGQPLLFDYSGPIRHPKISLNCARNPAYNLLDAPLTLCQHKAVQKMRTYVPTQGTDKLTWTLSASGLFSVSSAYTVLSQGGKLNTPIAFLWKTRATPSMKLFLYLMLNNRILTHDNLQQRNIPHTPGCVMCPHGASETVMHLFFLCPFSSQLWINISAHFGFPVITVQDSILETYISSRPPDRQSRKTWATAFITTTWLLWKERNQRIFRHTCSTVQVLTARILQEIDLCYTYC